MTNSTKDTYRIQYKDNTFQLVNWTEDQLFRVEVAMNTHRPAIMLDKSIFRLADIRAITYLPPVEESTDKTDGKGIVITEMGEFERELYNTLVQGGYELGDIIGEKEGN